jgi:hypothetical protein
MARECIFLHCIDGIFTAFKQGIQIYLSNSQSSNSSDEPQNSPKEPPDNKEKEAGNA